ncbi:MAG: hypothetical protein JNG83_05210 [Opitutaceae bacterium]|nr:hypothetical protein [Opitutaceae bacterium]
MVFFKRILNFKDGGAKDDKRGNARYPIGAAFPIKAKITLAGRDAEGNPRPPEDKSEIDWGGQLIELSSTGASIRLHPSAVAGRGENCCLKLELDHKLFEIDGSVAHYRSNKQYATCGILLKFPDFQTQKAYRQLMEPIIIGNTFQPVPAKEVKQDAPGLVKEVYAGEETNQLTVWRNETGGQLEYFELIVHDYYVRGTAQTAELSIGYRDGARVGKRVSTPSIPIALPPAPTAEVRQLFQWVVQNLTAKHVPAEVRAFLEKFAA